jgi:hypothetical protein
MSKLEELRKELDEVQELLSGDIQRHSTQHLTQLKNSEADLMRRVAIELEVEADRIVLELKRNPHLKG